MPEVVEERLAVRQRRVHEVARLQPQRPPELEGGRRGRHGGCAGDVEGSTAAGRLARPQRGDQSSQILNKGHPNTEAGERRTDHQQAAAGSQSAQSPGGGRGNGGGG